MILLKEYGVTNREHGKRDATLDHASAVVGQAANSLSSG